jgi:cytochrome c-type biogenesis protein CcmH/NrfG
LVFEVPVSEASALQEAVQKDPKNAEAWRKLGRYYYTQKDKARMVEAYEKALQLEPGDAELWDWLQKVK